MKLFKLFITLIFTVFCLTIIPKYALAFCGFYVGKADTSLYNKASQVIIAREGNRTVLTMSNDYQGEVKDFALVVPVPVVLKQEQVKVREAKILERLDAFSSPRLVEYFDDNPCEPRRQYDKIPAPSSAPLQESAGSARRDNALGVTVEEKFSVGEYDILILSAKESDGLEIWLRENGYKIPKGASQTLQPYIKQKLKFFVAKVNLEEFDKTGFQSLRPLQMAYESPKFMLPIRLGMINSQGEQDLIVYLLSPKGQIELTNYRTVKIPSDANIPEFVQKEFAPFYKSLFQRSYERENKKVAFLEYAWNMANCDPCSADPLNPEELKQAGVFWLPDNSWGNVFITRLHVRYTRDKFPEDLQFQETGNQQFFQGRYVMTHPYRAEMNCSAAQTYQTSVRKRQEEEAKTLANLTGWNINEIRKKIDFVTIEQVPWWRKLSELCTNIFKKV
ncbi:DUF2330 domain-containing protein [Gloeothece verrucosa]|uniref:DUF2330 domain-containing protein n=1 Tax=Gloeothece verrucosa (strain PCC 7822) TaxID=497965 RepID=E0UDZ8_GLOV7|nr:DUF2330 domain-containing protein [Gloeothece verrucosa]ADN13002.1 Protein of unknown function DUF2330 [Gloeothece verrucosa PCC 7822]